MYLGNWFSTSIEPVSFLSVEKNYFIFSCILKIANRSVGKTWAFRCKSSGAHQPPGPKFVLCCGFYKQKTLQIQLSHAHIELPSEHFLLNLKSDDLLKALFGFLDIF